MRYGLILIPLAFFFLLPSSCTKPSASPLPVQAPAEATQKDDQYKKEMDEIRKSIKSEVKIKLKRDGKTGAYSWEINGKDTDEVLRINSVLVKKLGTES